MLRLGFGVVGYRGSVLGCTGYSNSWEYIRNYSFRILGLGFGASSIRDKGFKGVRV